MLAPLILLKRSAGRPQDLSDVCAFIVALADADAIQADPPERAPSLVPVFAPRAG